MTLADQRIGFIGGGAMAEALVGGLLGAGVEAPQIRISEPRAQRRDQLADRLGRLGVETANDNAALVRASDLVVLAVKPDVALRALAELSLPDVEFHRPLWISIAAGVRSSALEVRLSKQARIVRAMPNTPALVQAGATALCGNAGVTAPDLANARALFESVGIVWETDDEALLDAVTGLSGSGPAYVFLFLEALIEAGEQVGLPGQAAERLVLQTLHGAVKLAMESDQSPAQLREQVSSPGGTTVAGLKEFEAGDFKRVIRQAVAAATRRSKELGG